MSFSFLISFFTPKNFNTDGIGTKAMKRLAITTAIKIAMNNA